MIIINTDFVQGKEIKEMLGLVKGNSVQAKHIGKDIKAGLRHIAGGEIKEYTEMLAESREIALKRMTEQSNKIRCRCRDPSLWNSSETEVDMMRITNTILFVSGIITILISLDAFINPNLSRWIKNIWGDKDYA